MNKIGLIIKREYIRRVSQKSFIILTFLMPLLMLGMVLVPLWLSSFKNNDIFNIAIIDQTEKYAPLFKNVGHYHFFDANQPSKEYINSDDKEVFATLEISDDLLSHPKAATLYSRKQIPDELSRIIDDAITKELEREKIASYQIPELEKIIKESNIQFHAQTIKLNDDGSESQSSVELAYAIGIMSTIIVYMFITMYGSMVMQGVSEEKTNRIVEIMVSSVRPFDLMMGKIIGIGLVGLTQIFLWSILTSVGTAIIGGVFGIGGGAETAMAMQNGASTGSENEIFAQLQSYNFREILFFFIIYFIGGYLIYASIFAAIGSVIDHPEDAQQFMGPVMLLLIFALYAGIYSIENPDGPLAFWCSMIPFTSPIVMMMRIPYEIPIWQLLISVAILYATAIGLIWLSAKIYRIGILMYGKKPRIKEIIKWISFK